MSQSSFADSAPKALGAFNPDRETLDHVRANGWQTRSLRPSCGYITSGYITGSGEFQGVRFEESAKLDQVRLRRRPCDGYSLQGEKARKFEEENPGYFTFKYQCARRGLSVSTGLDLVLRLAIEEFAALDYLQPLAAVIQAVRPDPRIPLITRCWDFGTRPGALIKSAGLALSGHPQDTIEGACICYQPPTAAELVQNSNNYFIFRNIVGHEVGHYWWQDMLRGPLPIELEEVRESEELLEQAVSLFSTFLIMYRGYWKPQPPLRDELGTAFEKLRFETSWAAQEEGRILDQIQSLPFPEREFPPSPVELLGDRDEDDVQLSNDAIFAIRGQARKLAERAASLPFASTAAVIAQRKIDNIVAFQHVDGDEFPRWCATNRSARHVSPTTDALSQWREYQIEIPRCNGNLPLRHYLEVARHLAHIRLHGSWSVGSGSNTLMRSEDVERECDADARDLARVLALALYAYSGCKKQGRMKVEIAKLLLDRDPSNLQYLVPYAEDLFQWCVKDPACPEADDRFLAEIQEVGKDEVHCVFWEETGGLLRASLPRSDFYDHGFSRDELVPGTEFKLFGVKANGKGRLLPARIPGGLDSLVPQEDRAAAAVPAG